MRVRPSFLFYSDWRSVSLINSFILPSRHNKHAGRCVHGNSESQRHDCSPAERQVRAEVRG